MKKEQIEKISALAAKHRDPTIPRLLAEREKLLEALRAATKEIELERGHIWYWGRDTIAFAEEDLTDG